MYFPAPRDWTTKPIYAYVKKKIQLNIKLFKIKGVFLLTWIEKEEKNIAYKNDFSQLTNEIGIRLNVGWLKENE